MNVKRTKQDERSEATRAALVGAARPLFAERGFAGVGTEEIVRAAGVTRGALYHQFRDKAELFEAVFNAVEEDVTGRIAEVVVARGAQDPLAAMRAGAEAWIDACGDPEIQRIVLTDAPGVLGWERWRELGQQHAMGLTENLLAAAMETGAIPRQPVRPLAHILVGALDEAAMYAARAPDQTTARAEVAAIIDGLLASLAAR